MRRKMDEGNRKVRKKGLRGEEQEEELWYGHGGFVSGQRAV